MPGSPIRIGIVAGEPSGDNLGSGLITRLQERFVDIQFFGIGGPRMREAGCDTWFDMNRIELMGLDGAFSKIRDILRVRSRLSSRMLDARPDLFIGIDVPDFNIPVELKLRKVGIPTLHYVSPTVWAWRGYRIHKIRRAVSHMMTLFPFEARFYEANNVPVTCVGHPMADEMPLPDRDRARAELDLHPESDELLIALLPGSRSSEIRRLAGLLVDSARELSRRHPQIRFVLPFANANVRSQFLELAGNLEDLPLQLFDGQARCVMEASDLAILASGTASLEASLLQRPHVVVYRVSGLTYWLFQRLRHVEYYSMTNHLLGEPMIPELIQHEATPHNVVAAVESFLGDEAGVARLCDAMGGIRDQLKRDANSQASQVVADMLELP